MASDTLIYSGVGSLPFSKTFQCNSDGPSLLFSAGSCWSNTTGSMIGLVVAIDGVPVTKLTILANASAMHLALVPQMSPVQLSYGQHTLTVTAATSNTVVDQNDNFLFVLQY